MTGARPVDPVVGLIRALLEHLRGASEGWQSLAMVLEFDGDGLRSTHGFAYGPWDVVSAVSARPAGIVVAVDTYTTATYGPDDAPPIKLLVQFDRTQGAYRIQFEDSDAARWSVTPATVDQVRTELRPHFE